MGGGTLILGERGPCRIWRSGGFPNFPGKSSPSSPSHPFLPLFLLLAPFLKFIHLSKPFHQLSRTGLIALSTLFFFLQTLSYLPQPFLRSLLDLLRTPSESLHRVPKGPKQPFLGLFRGTPKTPKKGLKTPFLTPFSPLPYPL